MDYLKQYRSFIGSHYVSDGIRITVAILVPVILFSYFGMLEIGLTVGLGALSVSITDNPGPIHHRRNGLIVSNLLIFAMAVVGGALQPAHWLFMILLPVFCFIFSMFGVYGARATSIGIASLFVLVLQTEHSFSGWDILFNGLYILAGGIWYVLLSLIIHSIRPYKMIQQLLGEYVITTADYLRAKASFFDSQVDYEKNYEELLRTQVIVQEKQALVAELLFKTRSIVKESTHTGRVLMMVFMDVADLFEITMTSHQDYEKLHRYFDDTNILSEYRQLINALAAELDEIGIALKRGRPSGHDTFIDNSLLQERKNLAALREKKLNPANLDGFISLRHILDSIEEVGIRIREMHPYTAYDKKLRKKKLNAPDPEDFIMHQPVDPQLLLDNLSFRSNIFRHSIRISAAVLFAYIISAFFPFGHSYWILLTVIVILKPAYSLTRTRNIERLSGTIIGALLGVVILSIVKDRTALVTILAISMVGAYSFMRKKYLVSVTLMTLYLLLMFHLLDPKDFSTIFIDRIIDTLIGSVIAVIFGYLLAPIWEHEQINDYMREALKDINVYHRLVTNAFTGKPSDKKETNLVRKNGWVSLANLSDAFNRMLSEPKSKQKNITYLHQFVVANHMLVSHIATLSYYTRSLKPEYITADYQPLITTSEQALQRALEIIEGKETTLQVSPSINVQARLLDNRIDEMMKERQEEIKQGQIDSENRKAVSDFKSIADQFYFINKVALDIEKIGLKWVKE